MAGQGSGRDGTVIAIILLIDEEEEEVSAESFTIRSQQNVEPKTKDENGGVYCYLFNIEMTQERIYHLPSLGVLAADAINHHHQLADGWTAPFRRWPTETMDGEIRPMPSD